MGGAAIHLSLLAIGSLFVSVPIVLHLTMRRKPKKLLFPALRFVKQRQQTNQTQLRLRHWLLLLLRCLAILLFVLLLALANLTAPSEWLGAWMLMGVLLLLTVVAGVLLAASIVDRRGRSIIGAFAGVTAVLALASLGVMFYTLINGGAARIGDKEAPVAAVIVVDTSPRMTFRRDNETRLNKAHGIAQWLLRRLPLGSRVVVTDSRTGDPIETVNLTAAQTELERLEPTAVSAPLWEKVEKAIRYADQSDFQQKEVYVFTDLTQTAWSGAKAAQLSEKLQTADDVLLYIIDVGVAEPVNFSLGDLELSQQTMAKNGKLIVETDVSSLGVAGARTLELLIEDQAPELPRDVDGKRELPPSRVRGQELVELDTGATQHVRFPAVQLEEGVHFGAVKILGEDGLGVDDIRYFTVEARQAWPVLVAAPEGVETRFLVEAISPYQFRETDLARFDCTVVDQTNLSNATLADYAAVCLIDPEPLTPGQWEQLTSYVEAGGSLSLFLGANATADALNQPAAQALLAGRIVPVPWREPTRDLFLAPKEMQHEILAPFRPLATTTPWADFPIYRHWVIDSLAPNTTPILHFSNNKIALAERGVGDGRVFTMTTPISDPLWRRGRRRPWNELPTGENAWPYFVLVNELLLSMVQSGSSPLNYTAGASAVLTHDADREPETYTLFAPQEKPQPIRARQRKLQVGYTETPGAYRLKGSRDGPWRRGFSVNLPAAETNLQRLKPGALDTLLGKDRYQLAIDESEIERRQSLAREDPPVYPYLIIALAVILALEQLMANRFYRNNE